MISEQKTKKLGLIICFTVLVFLFSITHNLAALSILVITTFLTLIDFRNLNYVALFFLIFAIASSKDVIELLNYITALFPFFFVKWRDFKISKEQLSYLISLVILITFKTLEYLSIPVALYYYYKKFDSRIFVGFAIALLSISAFVLSGSEEMANEIAIYAYYFLVLGVLGSLIEYLREGKGEEESENHRIKDGKVDVAEQS